MEALKRFLTRLHYWHVRRSAAEAASVIHDGHKHFLGEIHESARTVKRYEVESPSGERVVLIGFNVGRGECEYWTMSGRGVQYSSAEEALVALESEGA